MNLAFPRILPVLALLAALLRTAPALAERSHTDGEYVIHYNALPTTALSPDVARTYGITRSGTRALLNVAVLRQSAGDAEPRPVGAEVAARVRHLTGQSLPIELREVRDQDAIYYIGEFRIRGREDLRFELDVRPEGAGRTITARFEQHLVGE